MDFITPKQIGEALVLLCKWKGRARLVAGGTNVLPDLRSGGLKPSLLIDLSRIRYLSYIREEGHAIHIGSLTAIAELACSKVLEARASVLWQASRLLGNPLVRNRATIGGNLADASPAADTAVPLLALDAEVVIAKKDAGPRKISIDRFFVGPNKTVLKKDEMIQEVAFSKPD